MLQNFISTEIFRATCGFLQWGSLSLLWHIGPGSARTSILRVENLSFSQNVSPEAYLASAAFDRCSTDHLQTGKWLPEQFQLLLSFKSISKAPHMASLSKTPADILYLLALCHGVMGSKSCYLLAQSLQTWSLPGHGFSPLVRLPKQWFTATHLRVLSSVGFNPKMSSSFFGFSGWWLRKLSLFLCK